MKFKQSEAQNQRIERINHTSYCCRYRYGERDACSTGYELSRDRAYRNSIQCFNYIRRN